MRLWVYVSCIKTQAGIRICHRSLQRVTAVLLLHHYITLTQGHSVTPAPGSQEHDDSSM